MEVARELLVRRFGGSPELDEVEHLGGSGNGIVARARLAPSPFLPYRSVVVKHMPYTDSEGDDVAFLREVVAYQFTTSLPSDVRPGPLLLAHDVESRVLVLTDIGDAQTLVDALDHADERQRITILRQLGEQLGRMHAGTASRENDYDALLSRMMKKNPDFAERQAERDQGLLYSIKIGQDILAAAGLEPPAEFRDYAQHAADIQQSGRARAFTPFDLSPDNIVVGDKIHFLDYEWAGFRNVGFDAASVIAGFPQFLFFRPFTNKESEVFLSAWRREIIETWPRYENDFNLHRLVVSSLIGWALSSVSMLCADGMDALLAMLNQGLDEQEQAEFLRPSSQGPFTEDELLVRQDLYETFEALSRYSSTGGEKCRAVAGFAAAVAERLSPAK
ncbi:phosphotransferase [Corynebacterium phocae]|uniref:Phosphotransferase n=1 Tax=Corynebacterium phocae TaxID=161895 RepID=A0A1L7D6C2_9CORY|nr:phosphotransferase [Corynebacterium phocae]APT93694.1 phosphotransferase [Corynebacterium phocae]KAA8725198.1 phosphotransferase [Corynebacterium phocae]